MRLPARFLFTVIHVKSGSIDTRIANPQTPDLWETLFQLFSLTFATAEILIVYNMRGVRRTGDLQPSLPR